MLRKYHIELYSGVHRIPLHQKTFLRELLGLQQLKILVKIRAYLFVQPLGMPQQCQLKNGLIFY